MYIYLEKVSAEISATFSIFFEALRVTYSPNFSVNLISLSTLDLIINCQLTSKFSIFPIVEEISFCIEKLRIQCMRHKKCLSICHSLL